MKVPRDEVTDLPHVTPTTLPPLSDHTRPPSDFFLEVDKRTRVKNERQPFPHTLGVTIFKKEAFKLRQTPKHCVMS